MVNIEGLWPGPSRPWPISYVQLLPIIAMFLSIAQKIHYSYMLNVICSYVNLSMHVTA